MFDMELQVPGSLSKSNAKLQLPPSHFQYSDHHWYRDGTLVIRVSQYSSHCNPLT